MPPKKLKNPEHWPSGYSVHLYCDHENEEHRFQEFPHEITEYETLRASLAAARKSGWKIDLKERTATCPKCVRTLKAVNG